MSKVTFFSRRSVVAVSACPVFWGMDLCNMLSRQILQMVAMGLASREVAGRSTFSISLQGLLTPCLKRASFFFLFRQGFAPFVAKLLVIKQINMHTVVLETLISYCFFDNISHTVVTVCEKKKNNNNNKKKDRENRPSTPFFAVFKCFLLTTFSPISSFSLLQKESKIDA